MHQPLISTRVALTLIVALCGVAGWLDQPLDGETASAEPVPIEVPSMHLRCVSASTEAPNTPRAARPLLVSFAPDLRVAADLYSPDSTLLRCRIIN